MIASEGSCEDHVTPYLAVDHINKVLNGNKDYHTDFQKMRVVHEEVGKCCVCGSTGQYDTLCAVRVENR